MKTVRQVVAAVLVGAGVFGTSGAMAQARVPYYEEKSFDMAMYPASDVNKLWLVVDKPVNGRRLLVELLDARGRVLTTETLSRRSRSFHQRFDLSAIQDGFYTFRLTDGVQIREQTFRLTSTRPEEQVPQRYITMLPPTEGPADTRHAIVD